jgi:hypothetical protein
VDVFPLDLLATIVREPIFIPPLHLAWRAWRGNGVPGKMSSSICEEYRLIINVVYHAEQTKMYIIYIYIYVYIYIYSYMAIFRIFPSNVFKTVWYGEKHDG